MRIRSAMKGPRLLQLVFAARGGRSSVRAIEGLAISLQPACAYGSNTWSHFCKAGDDGSHLNSRWFPLASLSFLAAQNLGFQRWVSSAKRGPSGTTAGMQCWIIWPKNVGFGLLCHLSVAPAISQQPPGITLDLALGHQGQNCLDMELSVKVH